MADAAGRGRDAPLWDQGDLERWVQSPTPLQPGEAGDWNSLLADLGRSQEALMGLLTGLSADDLERQTPFGPLGSVLAFLATHEAYHVGQLAMLRRALGMPGVLKGLPGPLK
ncbi:MAG: DinB family protein [Meiothermus sp.]|nr:DinB family protein [Meiothermus sp.]